MGDESDFEDAWGEEPEWVLRQEAADRNLDNGSKDNKALEEGAGARHVMMLLDCRPSMWVPCIAAAAVEEYDDDDQERQPPTPTLVSPMEAALTVCERLLRAKVMEVATTKTGKRDGVGVLLYGTSPPARKAGAGKAGANDDEEQEQLDQDSDMEEDEDDHIPYATTSTRVLLLLEAPGIPHVRGIVGCLPDEKRGGKRMRNLQEEFGDFDAEHEEGHEHPMGSMALRSALHEAIRAYANAKCVNHNPSKGSPPDAKAIWIFTNDDNPSRGNDLELRHIQVLANDAEENGISIHVLPLAGAATEFRRDVFWDHVETRFDPGSPVLNTQTMLNLDELIRHIQRRLQKVRKVFTHPLLLPDWRDRPEDEPAIMVDFFRVVNIRKRPAKFQVHQRTKQEVIRVTQVLDDETGEILATTAKTELPSKGPGDKSLSKYTEFGDEFVFLTDAEVADIKKMSNATESASLVLLGFRHVDSVPLHFTLDRSYFLYPNEELVKGSTAAFANLHSAMIRKNVLAIVEFLSRSTAMSRLAALYPQQQEVEMGEEGSQTTVQVMPPGMILIELPFEDDIRELGKDAGHVVPEEESVEAAMNLISKLKIRDFDLSEFPNQALELFWNYIESVALGTNPMSPEDFEPVLDEKAILEVAGSEIEAFRNSLPEDVVVEKTSRKRKVKAEVEDDSGIDWVDLYKTSSLEDCTAENLKKFLRSRGARLSGRKADLVFRVSKMIAEELEKVNLGQG